MFSQWVDIAVFIASIVVTGVFMYATRFVFRMNRDMNQAHRNHMNQMELHRKRMDEYHHQHNSLLVSVEYWHGKYVDAMNEKGNQ